jgi:hypothetical protein
MTLFVLCFLHETAYARHLHSPPPFSVSITAHTNVSCNGGSDGTATATASNGTTPYTYNWSNGASGATITGLSAGTYTVTANDNASHTATATVTISQPTALSVSITITNVSCNGNSDGKLVASPSGGTGAYTYSWAPSGGTAATAKNLSVGSYTVTVTDHNGCTITASATITQPTSLSVGVGQIIDVKCFGASTGMASSSGIGGTTPYTYTWHPGGSTNPTVTGLAAGTYTVTVKDANGCTANHTVIITQPTKLKVTVSESDVLCNGQSTGSATATPSGGTGAYTYSWAPSGGTNATASNLSAGTYTVTVTDANNCSVTASTTITQPTALSVTAGSTNVVCYGAYTGTASASASGGKGTYNYLWLPTGGTHSTANGLSAATYTVTVTDANGCTATATTTITQPATPFIATATATGVCGSGNNSASVSASGGTSPYTYTWSPSGGTGTNATALSAGIYTVTVTDAIGCTAKATVNVANLVSPSVTISPNAVSIYSGQPVTLVSSVSGGAYPYTYSWTPSTSLSCTTCYNPVSTPTSNITYALTVTDHNGCTGTASALIDVSIAPPVNTPTSCDTCIGGLNLVPGKTYLVSIWAKNNVTSPADTDYKEPAVKVEFGATVFGPFLPQGRIIDGWQRIEGQFTVPLTATTFNIVLSCKGGDCNFDDIRVFPFNGTLKTYVYDPITLRLAAVLDERNYATIYEYDEEGKLIRVKKETERGIMTIQESRTAMQKR